MRPPGCPRAWRRRPPGHSDCREHRPDPSPTQLQEAEEGEARGAPVGQGLLRAGTSPCTQGAPLQGDRLRSGLSDLLQRTGCVCTAPPHPRDRARQWRVSKWRAPSVVSIQ